MNDEEAHESSDIVTDDGILSSQPFRSRRSESVSSTPHIQPTPLSQSHTAADLCYMPRVNTSQSNLSIKSGRSGKSSRSRLGRRSRRNTERSDDPPGRPSVDKAFSFASRRSNTEPEPLTRDEKIREKRRQFNEKEASKDRKQHRQEIKRRETDEAKSVKQGRKSSLSQHERPQLEQRASSKIQSIRKTTRTNTEKSEELRARSYDDARPANLTALPKQAVVEEKPRRAARTANEPPGTWPRFSTWRICVLVFVSVRSVVPDTHLAFGYMHGEMIDFVVGPDAYAWRRFDEIHIYDSTVGRNWASWIYTGIWMLV